MSDKRNRPRLRSGYTYHICNRGNNKENIFKESRNYSFFLEKYRRFIHPICYTYAYCLMPNHFHLMVQFKSYKDLHTSLPREFPPPVGTALNASDIETTVELEYDEQVALSISHQFRKFFGGYARSFNMTYQRTGKLLEVPFHRIHVNNDTYFQYLIAYIHRNPIHHLFTKDYASWEYSSYQEILSYLSIIKEVGKTNYVSTKSANTILDLPFLKDWFESREAFLHIHQEALDWLEERWRLEP